ncbi:hypothetical protein [Aminobacter sp. AP02]|uniref:hypothetical protein n=1 Tax=Aminobacter sp. AP02 TaxID=2135737 RepID=UPI00130498E4|nr:hypothetical protein [Aminobacter sp. AP02]
MKNIHKRLNLAASALTVSLLLLKNVNILIELVSKVVNYARGIRKFPAFVLEERQTDLRA